MFLAWKIESELSKNEILELFLNKIPFGHRAYGLGAASQVYYGTTLDNLSINQDADQIKQRIGYLPEHNPLYLDMPINLLLIYYNHQIYHLSFLH